MWRGINKDITPPLDAHYYLGCGARGGCEREVVYEEQTVFRDDVTIKTADGVAFSLDAMHRQQCVNEPREPLCMATGQANAEIIRGGCPTLNANHEQPIVESEPVMMSDRKGHNGITEDGTATTLTAQEKDRPVVGRSVVRRLTPTECARLQMFPDDWCDIGEWTDSKGKVHKDADTPKYKAYGNSIALPFWAWLTRRISAQYDGNPPTLGSLFDGIGGFPLCWARVNGADSVRWASEIEEFPIAVTKQHFGDEDAGMSGDIRKYL